MAPPIPFIVIQTSRSSDYCISFCLLIIEYIQLSASFNRFNDVNYRVLAKIPIDVFRNLLLRYVGNIRCMIMK